jgi:hypothetical protein
MRRWERVPAGESRTLSSATAGRAYSRPPLRIVGAVTVWGTTAEGQNAACPFEAEHLASFGVAAAGQSQSRIVRMGVTFLALVLASRTVPS